MGIALLALSLLADGFLPDWQAEIKNEYKPKPLEMLQSISKCVAFISLFWLIFIDRALLITLTFMKEHPLFMVHICSNVVINFIGQNFIYWMITEFKQHIVPFIISSRKLITVVLSIVFYHHEVSFLQLAGMSVVFVTVFL